MKINYRKQSKRTEQARQFWLKVAADYNAGMSASDIARRYINPLTGKNYNKVHIHWILRKVAKL